MSENNWIPCKDRLPNEEGLILLQTKRDGRMYVGYHRKGTKWFCVIARNSTVTGMIPIAWQSLPEKYTE